MEQSDLNHKVQEIVDKTPLEVIAVMEKLTECLLNNYFFNFSQSLGEKSFRGTSDLFTLLLTLVEKYPYLSVYLCFQVRDYTYLKEVHSQASIIHHIDDDGLRSITFIECLFKINYFYVHSQDLYAISKLFASFYTGIILVDLEDPKCLLDVSHIMIVKLLNYIDTDLKQKNTSPNNADRLSIENYGLLYNSVSAVSCILNSMNCDDLKIPSFERDFKAMFLSIIKQILHTLTASLRNEFRILQGYGDIDTILVSALDKYYDYQLNSKSYSKNQINAIKSEIYKQLWTNQKQTLVPMKHEYKHQSNLCSSDRKTPNYFSIFNSKLAEMLSDIESSTQGVRILNLPIHKHYNINQSSSLLDNMTTRMNNTIKLELSYHKTLRVFKNNKSDHLIWPNLGDYINFLISGLSEDTKIIQEPSNYTIEKSSRPRDHNASPDQKDLDPSQR